MQMVFLVWINMLITFKSIFFILDYLVNGINFKYNFLLFYQGLMFLKTIIIIYYYIIIILYISFELFIMIG